MPGIADIDALPGGQLHRVERNAEAGGIRLARSGRLGAGDEFERRAQAGSIQDRLEVVVVDVGDEPESQAGSGEAGERGECIVARHEIPHDRIPLGVAVTVDDRFPRRRAEPVEATSQRRRHQFPMTIERPFQELGLDGPPRVPERRKQCVERNGQTGLRGRGREVRPRHRGRLVFTERAAEVEQDGVGSGHGAFPRCVGGMTIASSRAGGVGARSVTFPAQPPGHGTAIIAPESSQPESTRVPASGLLTRAFAQREPLRDAGETAYRMFHGWGEGCPGLAIDRYGDCVLITDKRAADAAPPFLPTALPDLILAHTPAACIAIRRQHRAQWNPTPQEVVVLHGALPDGPTMVRTGGCTYETEPTASKHPGLFLDTRPLRAWLRDHSRDRRVLNLFAFTGSLGVAALAGGAREVIHVDMKPRPLATARRNHELNDQRVDARNFVKGSVYDLLPRAGRGGQRFGGILLDPPPQVPVRNRRLPPGQDYASLIPRCLPVLADDGWLVCTLHRYDQRSESYRQIIESASGGRLELIDTLTSGDEFPEDDPEKKLRILVFGWRRLGVPE